MLTLASSHEVEPDCWFKVGHRVRWPRFVSVLALELDHEDCSDAGDRPADTDVGATTESAEESDETADEDGDDEDGDDEEAADAESDDEEEEE